MATTARLGIDITATDRTRTAFNSAKRSLDHIDRSLRQLKGAFAGLTGGNLLAGLVRSLVDINKHTEPVKSAVTTLHRAWQAFALQVGSGGLNDALVRFVDTMSKMLVGSNRLSNVLGNVLAGVINGLRRGLEVLGRTIGFVYDNFEAFKNLVMAFAAIQIATKVFTLGQAFVRLMLAIRATTIVMQLFHMMKQRIIVVMLGAVAVGAKLMGTYEDLEKFMKGVWKTAEGLAPVLGEKLDKALKLLGFDTAAFTEDFDQFGEKLKNLPKTFAEMDADAKGMKPFDAALTNLDQYIQGLKDQTAAVGMSEGALARLAQSQDFYNKMQDKGIKLTAAQREEAERRLNQIPDLIEKLNAQRSNLQFLQSIGQSFADTFTEGLTAIADKSKSVGAAIKDMVKNLIQSLTQLFINRAFQVLLNGSGGSSGIIGSIASGLGFGGPRAAGGPVSPGKGYVVGERGPEMFVPGTSGTIIPPRGGGGFTKVEIHNHGGRVRQEERRGPNGEKQLRVWFDAMFDQRMAGQSTDKIMGAKFGLRPTVARRSTF